MAPLILLLAALTGASGCGEPEELAPGAEIGGFRDVNFGPMTITVSSVPEEPAASQVSIASAPRCTGNLGAGVYLQDGVRDSQTSFDLDIYAGASASFPGIPARGYVEVGKEICLGYWTRLNGGPFNQGEKCVVLEPGRRQLDFDFSAVEGDCQIDIEVPSVTSRFVAQDFCESSCDNLSICGRPEEGCVESCLSDVRNVPVRDDPMCHDVTRRWISCLHNAPCANDDADFACSIILSSIDSMFDRGECVRPLPPPPPEADPLRCDPTQDDLVSGNEGDFMVVSVTRDYPDMRYLIFDLKQLAEVDGVVDENPDDPALEVARSVVPALDFANQSSRDECERTDIVSILFTPGDGEPNPPDFDAIHNQLVRLQNLLEELEGVVGNAKKEATEVIFKQVFCPATGQAFGGGFIGIAAQAVVGCFS
jgi:hypothetical protein